MKGNDNMQDNIEKVFDIIGIQPNKPFFFKYGTDKNSYYINERLHIKSCKNNMISEDYTIRDLLMDSSSIETKNSIKAKIETIFKFLIEIYNLHYLAKDKNKKIYAYTEKPIKTEHEWTFGTDNTFFSSKEINYELIPQYLIDHISKLVSWEDDEPLDMRKPDMWQRLI